jgi:3-oxoacyl-[acyl-carrier protein] reductase
MSNAQPLAGKVAIVTGAARGIGRAIAERLGADGAHVVVNYRSEEKQAAAAAARIQKNDVRAAAVQADVSKTEDIQKLFKTTIDLFGAVDILVNNAGIALPHRPPIAEVTDEEYDRLFAVNAMALPGYSVYAGTKAAVEIWTKIFAKELSGKQITVNAVAPGPVETELFNEGKTEADKQRMAEMCPLGRLGRPADIAQVVAFLAGPDGGWVNGQILLANGGLA